MITKYFFRLMSLLPAALFAAGCLGDNYDQPDSALYGQVIDMETGEVVLQDIGASGSVIDVLETGYANATARTLNFKTDGSYRDNNFFKGYYTVSATRANFVPVDEELIHLSGETEYVFEVQPYCRISVKSLALDLEKQRINASFTVECTTTDPLAQVALFCDQSKHVSFSINNSGIRDCRVNVGRALLVPETFSIRMPLTTLDDDADYWFRIGALSSVAEARWNYAEAVKIHIVKQEIEEPELGMRWDLFDSFSRWQAGKNATQAELIWDEADYKSGNGSVSVTSYPFAQSGGYTTFISPGSKAITPAFDASAIPFDGCHMLLTINVSDATHFPSNERGQIEISSSGKPDDEEVNWMFGQIDLRNGWQTLDLALASGNAMGSLRMDNINYFRMYHLDETGPTTVKFDEIRFYYKTLAESCDDKTGWASANPVSVDENDCKEGEGCICSTNGAAGIRLQKVWSSPFACPASKASGHFQFWLYVSDAAAVNGASGSQIEITSAGKPDENELNWPVPTLSDGWNLIDLKLSEAKTTGGAIDLRKINFFRIWANMSAGPGTVTVKIDRLRFFDEGVNTSLMDIAQ